MKIIQGTLRNDRANGDEPIMRSVEPKEVQCPNYLSRRARRVFKQIREILAVDMRVMTTADRHSLILLADAWDEYMEARKAVLSNGLTYEIMDENGNTQTKTNPAVYIRNNAWKKCKDMLIQFGMTPASRTKVKTEVEQKEDNYKRKAKKSW